MRNNFNPELARLYQALETKFSKEGKRDPYWFPTGGLFAVFAPWLKER